MSKQSVLNNDELAFERLLLGAGLAEPLPHDRTEAALQRFAVGMAALQGGAVGVAAVGAPAAGKIAGPWARRLATMKWLALGFFAGGVATFAWLRPTMPPRVSSAPVAAALAPPAPAPPALAPAAPPMPKAQPATANEPIATTALEPARSQRGASASAGAVGASTAARTSLKSGPDLAAEVMALDAIRTALSIGALHEAELKLARYRDQFAQGALRGEADVLGLELLVAQGRTQAAKRAAERFISQRPRDPQVARVRALVE